MSPCAAVTLKALTPSRGHARSKQNKHDYSEQILKSFSNFTRRQVLPVYGYGWIWLEPVLFSFLYKDNGVLVLFKLVRNTTLTVYFS